MIALSRFRRVVGADGIISALILLASLAVPACDSTDSPKSCTLIGCLGQGLDIVFDGEVAPGTTLQIEIALVEQQNVAPVINCTLSGAADPDAGMEDLFCNSNFWISQHGRTLNTHEILTTVRVTISSGGNQLSQQTFTPTYTRNTPNGPGCGTCTYSTINVALPQASQP